MTGRRKWGLAAGGLALVALAALSISLPRLVGNALLSQARQIGLLNPRLRVLHVGINRLKLAGVTLGAAAAPELRIENVVVSYSLPGLLRKEIQGIDLHGVTVRVESQGEGLRFLGWHGPAKPAETGAIPRIGRLLIESGVMKLLLSDRQLDVPFSARLNVSGAGYALRAKLRPFATPIRLEGRFDREFASGTIAFMNHGIDLISLTRQGIFGSSLSASGWLSLQGEVGLSNGRFSGAKARAGGRGKIGLDVPGQGMVEADLRAMTFRLSPDFTPRDIHADVRVSRLNLGGLAVNSPFLVEARGSHWPDIDFSILGMRLDRPLPLFFERISGKTAGPWAALKIRGDFRVQDRVGLPAALAAGPWTIDRPYVLTGSFQGNRNAGGIAWTLKAAGNGALALSAGKDRVRSALKLDATLEGDSRQARARLKGRLTAVDLRLDSAHAQAGTVDASVEAALAFAGGWSGRGTLQVGDGRYISAANDGMRVEGICLRLPWSDPASAPGKSGKFSIASLMGGGAIVREIQGILSQEGQKLAFSGQGHGGLPGIAVFFAGSAAPRNGVLDGQMDFHIPSTLLPTGTSLQGLHPLFKGMEAGGRLTVRGTLGTRHSRLAGSSILEIADADLNVPGAKFSLRGLQAAVTLESLFDLVTAPKQHVRFSELLWQSVALSNGEIAFRGEGGGALFVESASFAWSGGTVTVDALRLVPGMKAIEATLRCRDVDLAEMLNALAGEEIVSGEARLSGVIPMKLNGGDLQFMDGRLDSTPGRTGQLRVSKPEAISGGQVLVEEAIREFDYNWIKVRLDGGGDRLNMIVSIDGAPARKLPLRYDQKKGDFVRQPAGKPGVELKGLLLDIRFIDINLKDLLDAGGRVTAGGRIK